jgi:hypothetical protein
MHAPFPALLPFLKFILEIVFFEGVQHHLRVCLIASIVSKWRPFSSIFDREDDSHAVFVQNSQVKKKVREGALS